VAKESGLGDNFYLAQFDLSGDIGSLGNISGGHDPLELTGINKSGKERLGGARDGSIEFTTFFNTATDAEHDALKGLTVADRVISYFRGTALGNAAASLVAKQGTYNGERSDDGSLTCEVEAKANGYGTQWGVQLTAGKRTDGTATNGTGVDLGTGSTAFGLQAFLHVFAFSGTSTTIKIQESSDNGSGDAFADVTGGAFTTVTGVTSQRIATASGLTVERYLRCVTTGTFSNVVFAVNVIRNSTAVSF
jgi:hypothetical protein